MSSLLKNKANFSALTPLSFLYRTAEIFPKRLAWIYEKRKATYQELLIRSKRLAGAIKSLNVNKGDIVAVMLPNVPEMIEAHFGVPMSGAILNSLNTRLEKRSIEYILKHSKSKILIFHEDYIGLIKSLSKRIKLKYIIVKDKKEKNYRGILEYDSLLNQVNFEKIKENYFPKDEWESISLNYTSGTTGNPKGVLYHHRGAHLMCFNNQMVWKMGYHPIYLWTLPMFHCNGWCFPWTITALAGTHICLRTISAKNIYESITKHNVTHMCGAPIILSMIINAEKNEIIEIKNKVNIMTAAAAPPPAILAEIEKKGFEVTHVYGLTEVYGPAVVCEWKEEWNSLKTEPKSKKKARQGVQYPSLEELSIRDPKTMKPIPKDGKTIGEVMMRGNMVMKGYHNNKKATNDSFSGAWFHTGDLGVMHEDGYIELKDRSKDIIISGGENISSIEIEEALYKNRKVLVAAVVAKPDKKWGETPCAFVELKDGEKATEKEIIEFCKTHIASFKCPKTIIFQIIPKTSTGKIQKFQLREIAKEL